MMKKLAPLMAALFVTFVSTAAQATPLNQWKVSCSVDKGSIQKKGNTRIFKTSTNHCPGGTFNQRAEIASKKVSRNHKGKYKFTSAIRMTDETVALHHSRSQFSATVVSNWMQIIRLGKANLAFEMSSLNRQKPMLCSSGMANCSN